MAASLNGGGRDRRSRYRPMAEINVTPLVDVMLVLLIIFMVAAPLMTVGVPVDLPRTAANHAPLSPLTFLERAAAVFPQRTAVVLQQLRTAQLYPSVAAPAFNLDGGTFPPGFQLTMTAAATVYYTLDGTDPTEASSLYTEPFSVNTFTIVKARGFRPGAWVPSERVVTRRCATLRPICGGTARSRQLAWGRRACRTPSGPS